MKVAVKKRYICPASEVFEMGGNDVLLAGSNIDFGGHAGQTPGDEVPDVLEEDNPGLEVPAPGFYDAFENEW
jgi:hypothetical protein